MKSKTAYLLSSLVLSALFSGLALAENPKPYANPICIGEDSIACKSGDEFYLLTPSYCSVSNTAKVFGGQINNEVKTFFYSENNQCVDVQSHTVMVRIFSKDLWIEFIFFFKKSKGGFSIERL